MADANSIESTLKEKRLFAPDAKFAKQANLPAATYKAWVKEAREEPGALLGADGARARQLVRALEEDARVEAAVREVVRRRQDQRQLQLPRPAPRGEHAWRRNKAAIIWEGEPGDTRVLTYGELHREVCKFANVLQGARRREGRPRRASTCRWCPSWRSRCSRARASARRTRHLRRLLRRRGARPHQRRRGEARRHRRRRLAPRAGRAR